MKRLSLILFSCLVMVAALVRPASALDPPHSTTFNPPDISCEDCHILHNAPGAALTERAGNANLCQKCHVSGGLADAKALPDSVQALPRPGLPKGMSPSGTSHRWDSGPLSGHAEADTANTSTGTVESGGSLNGTSPKTYTITIDTGGEVGTADFDWADTLGNGATNVLIPASGTPGVSFPVTLNEGVTVTFTDGTPTSFVSGDIWRVYVRPEIRIPTNAAMAARIDNGKIMCSTCHDQHSQANQPSDPLSPTYGGSGTGTICIGGVNDGLACALNDGTHCPGGECKGRHFQRIDNDTNQMCEDCHAARVGVGLHLTQSTLPMKCMDCHFVHDVSGTSGSDDGSLTREENTCYDCHDGSVSGVPNVFPQFNSATNYEITGGINSRHDVSDADQTFSGNVVECATCHNPHTLTATNKLMNPDNWSDGTTNFVAGEPFTKTYSRTGFYGSDQYCSDCDPIGPQGGDLDPVNPEGLPAGPSIGPAVEGVHNGDDLGTSGGTYTGTEDLTYTVTISPGGTPGGGAGISVTTGSSTECPTSTPCTASVTFFDTFVNFGNFGVQIKFQDGGSGGTPSSTGIPNCNNPVNQGGGHTCTGVNNNISNDDTATSSGTYMGPSNGTYTLRVTTAGCVQGVSRCPNTGTPAAVITCTSDISGDACNEGPTGYAWPNPPTTPISIGSYGVQVTISDAGGREREWELELDQQWTIAVNATSGDTLLTAGDTWTIAVTAGGATFSEPDYVAFCLTCHDTDNSTELPPPGVTITGLTVISDEYFSRDVMGAQPGGTGTSIGNGYLKEPWHVQPASCTDAGGWTDCEDPTDVYAALNCTVCHDGHGSDNLYHLQTSINVAGEQLYVGGDNPSSQFGPGSTFDERVSDPVNNRYLSTTYSLPCQGGNGEPDCANNPTGAQEDFHYGAWCTFCHEMSSHPSKTETGSSGSCATSHSHGGGNF